MVECLIQSKPGIPKTTGVDREPQVMGATGDGAPQETAPAEATPTRRPHFRSATKDGVGRGTLGRGWGRREAQPPGDSTRTASSGRGTGHDFASRH